LGIPSGDTQDTRDLGSAVPKTRGYPNHCDTANEHAVSGFPPLTINHGLESRDAFRRELEKDRLSGEYQIEGVDFSGLFLFQTSKYSSFVMNVLISV